MNNFVNRLNNYQPVPRSLVFDATITDRARFVYVYLASKPEGWNFYVASMCKELGYSEDTLHKYINELVAHGWLSKEQSKNAGTFGTVVYTLHDRSTVEDGDVIIPAKEEQKGKVERTLRTVIEDRYGALEAVREDIRDDFYRFLHYRIRIGKPYKLTECVVSCYDNLVGISGGDVKTMREIIKQTMSNQWEGLFPLKNSSNGRSNRQDNRRSQTEYRVDAVTDFRNEESDI